MLFLTKPFESKVLASSKPRQQPVKGLNYFSLRLEHGTQLKTLKMSIYPLKIAI